MFFTLTLRIENSEDDEYEWNTSERVVHGDVAGNVGFDGLDTDK
jgi:hypothetical protein